MSNGRPITIGPGLLSSGGVGVFGTDSFSQKLIEIAIALGAGGAALSPSTFSSSGTGTVTISGARTSVRVTFAGGYVGSSADISIWGLSQSLMNELQTLGIEYNKVARNVVTVTAGDAVNGLSTVFTGNVIQAWGDYNAAPDVAIRLNCKAGVLEGSRPLPATSFNGSVSVVTLFSTIAQGAGWGFTNNGVDSSISVANPYYAGSAVDQYKKLMNDARVNAALVPGSQQGQNYVLFIWPQGGLQPQPGAGVPIISPDTGMVGYPTFAPNGGIFVRTLYNPQIAMGNQIQVQSSLFTNQSLAILQSPNSLWTVYRVDHALDSLVPKGQWVSTIFAAVPNPFKPTLPPPP